MKKGILVVSFGTSHPDTMDQTISVIEEEIRQRYPEYAVYRAFTSETVIRKLKRRENLSVDTVQEALRKMAKDGIEKTAVQPTLVINGLENDRMLKVLLDNMKLFREMSVGKPLLSSVADYKKAIHAVMCEIHIEEDEALVLMGNGTDHHANSAYPMLEYTFHALGYNYVLVGTIDSFPDLHNVRTKLEISGKRKVVLMPFMLTAGNHAKKDMAGEEDSWKSELEAEGYDVRIIMRGLGEFPGIRRIFLEHLDEIIV